MKCLSMFYSYQFYFFNALQINVHLIVFESIFIIESISVRFFLSILNSNISSKIFIQIKIESKIFIKRDRKLKTNIELKFNLEQTFAKSFLFEIFIESKFFNKRSFKLNAKIVSKVFNKRNRKFNAKIEFELMLLKKRKAIETNVKIKNF